MTLRDRTPNLWLWGTKGNVFIADCVRRGMHLDLYGRIISPHGHIHKCGSLVGGYRRICLWAFGQDMSVLKAKVVCWLAHGAPPKNNSIVDHIDRNKSNDRPSNLRWRTNSQNCLNVSPAVKAARQRHMDSIRTVSCGEKHGRSKLTDRQVRGIREEYDKGTKPFFISLQYNISKQQVSKIGKRRTWRHLV